MGNFSRLIRAVEPQAARSPSTRSGEHSDRDTVIIEHHNTVPLLNSSGLEDDIQFANSSVDFPGLGLLNYSEGGCSELLGSRKRHKL